MTVMPVAFALPNLVAQKLKLLNVSTMSMPSVSTMSMPRAVRASVNTNSIENVVEPEQNYLCLFPNAKPAEDGVERSFNAVLSRWQFKSCRG
jgi:hypothetical protein